MKENVPKYVKEYIEELEKSKEEWDIIFDYELDKYFGYKYKDQEINNNKKLYLKSNKLESNWHGSTKGASFYIINLKCAKKLYENFIPFNNVIDFWMNDLFRKLNIKSYWVIPSNV